MEEEFGAMSCGNKKQIALRLLQRMGTAPVGASVGGVI